MCGFGFEVVVKQLKAVPSVVEAAVGYKKVSAEIEALEAVKREYCRILLDACPPKDPLILDCNGVPIKIKRVEVAKETFDLKTAREKVAADVLKPFIKLSVYEYVRVS